LITWAGLRHADPPKRERWPKLPGGPAQPRRCASFSAVEANAGLRDAPPPSPVPGDDSRRFEFDRREKDEPPTRRTVRCLVHPHAKACKGKGNAKVRRVPTAVCNCSS
jgi:hypothetical protein